MEYVGLPVYMSNISETPNINAVYHPGISYYVASRIATEIYGDEETEKMMLLKQFDDYISKSFARLNTRKRRSVVKAPQWG
jgi:DNA polymerase III delta prime subunit